MKGPWIALMQFRLGSDFFAHLCGHFAFFAVKKFLNRKGRKGLAKSRKVKCTRKGGRTICNFAVSNLLGLFLVRAGYSLARILPHW
jgi:hypothetical protein